MANQRFQNLSTAQQFLFKPGCPVQVNRWQLSRDMETGKRLLQVRMINLSEKRIRQVFLRIRCMDGREQRLEDLELIPLPVLSALPGRVFGDDKVVEITVPGTTYVEIFPQRVRFYDESVWNEENPGDEIAYAQPVRVRPGDPDYDELSRRAMSGGVRNQFYYHTQQGVWTCTCGVPNGSRALRCAHCGADRLWLEKHMDPAVVRETVRTAPAPGPVPAPEVPQTQPAPVTLAPIVIRQTVPTPARPESRPKPQAPKPAVEETEVVRSSAGKTAAIVLSILFALVICAFAAYLWLRPYLRYEKGIEQMRAGNYTQAQEIFEALGEYRDSPDRIRECILNTALSAMSDGKYEDAVRLLETLPDQQKYIADCIYSMGVLAYNDGDLDKALSYVEELESRFPDYDKLPQLKQYCSYSLGNRLASDAAGREAPEQRIEVYYQAINAFTEAGDYGDSAERITECMYRIAIEELNRDNLMVAIDSFEKLNGYKQSSEYRHTAMFRTLEGQTVLDEQGKAWLNELVEAEYPGAAAMLRRLDGTAFRFSLGIGRENSSLPKKIEDLKQIYINYEIEPTDENGAVPVLMVCTLPDGREARALLNSDHSADGRKSFESCFPVDCTASGTVTLRFYDSQRSETSAVEEFTFDYQYVPPEPEPTEPEPGSTEDKP